MQDDEALGSPLSRACRLQQGAAAVGFDWPDASGPLAKVKEEIGELEREAGKGKRETVEDEIGDLLFAVVNLARKLGVDPDDALERANDQYLRRARPRASASSGRPSSRMRASSRSYSSSRWLPPMISPYPSGASMSLLSTVRGSAGFSFI